MERWVTLEERGFLVNAHFSIVSLPTPTDGFIKPNYNEIFWRKKKSDQKKRSRPNEKCHGARVTIEIK